MKIDVRSVCTVALLACGLYWHAPAMAQQDKAAAERAQRRAQQQAQQAQQLQQQAQEAQAARAKAESERDEARKAQQAGEAALARAASGQGRLAGELKSLQSARSTLAARVTQLEQQLAAQKAASEQALAAREGQVAQATKQREAERGESQARFAEQVRLVTECSEKNTRLGRLSVELIERYRNKSLGDVARDREPLLGLSEVQTFNLLQELRDRADAERFKPMVGRP